jgi:hypothetical protein
MSKPLDPQRFERAVKTLALYRAKSAVLSEILAKGQKIGQFSCAEINEMRQAYFAHHMEELITKATADVATFPEFARFWPD